MAKVKVYNMLAEEVGTMTLSDDVFAVESNDSLIHQVVVAHNANNRQGTKSTLTRSEVRGHAKKPWKQKHTGHARQGSIRAVQWRGGGIAFGPTPRDYSKKMNRKERRLALLSALSTKVADMVVVEELTLATPKTKDMVALLKGLKLENTNTLVIVKELDENIILASRNLENVVLIEASEINVLDLVSADKILTTEEALKKIEEVLA